MKLTPFDMTPRGFVVPCHPSDWNQTVATVEAACRGLGVGIYPPTYVRAMEGRYEALCSVNTKYAMTPETETALTAALQSGKYHATVGVLPPTGIAPYVVLTTENGILVSHPFSNEYEALMYQSTLPAHVTAEVHQVLTRRVATGPDALERAAQILRSGRWGTCSGCPKDHKGDPRPEACEYTVRYDHNIDPNNTLPCGD